MAEVFQSTFKPPATKQEDGSLTVTLQCSGLPDLDAANKVSLWMRDIIRGERPQDRTAGRFSPSSVTFSSQEREETHGQR